MSANALGPIDQLVQHAKTKAADGLSKAEIDEILEELGDIDGTLQNDAIGNLAAQGGDLLKLSQAIRAGTRDGQRTYDAYKALAGKVE